MRNVDRLSHVAACINEQIILFLRDATVGVPAFSVKRSNATQKYLIHGSAGSPDSRVPITIMPVSSRCFVAGFRHNQRTKRKRFTGKLAATRRRGENSTSRGPRERILRLTRLFVTACTAARRNSGREKKSASGGNALRLPVALRVALLADRYVMHVRA